MATLDDKAIWEDGEVYYIFYNYTLLIVNIINICSVSFICMIKMSETNL